MEAATRELEAARTQGGHPTLRYLANVFLGLIESAGGRGARATEFYSEALRLYPASQTALLGMSEVAYLEGRLSDAASLMTKLLQTKDKGDPWWQVHARRILAPGTQADGASKGRPAVRATLALGVVVAASVATSAVQDPGRFKSRADLVLIDVLVTDGRRAVTGLTPGDFELHDNTVPQSIEQLYMEQLPLDDHHGARHQRQRRRRAARGPEEGSSGRRRSTTGGGSGRHHFFRRRSEHRGGNDRRPLEAAPDDRRVEG